MNKIDELIENMKGLHQELNMLNSKNVNIDELKKLRDFTQGYVLDVQELIYGFQEIKDK